MSLCTRLKKRYSKYQTATFHKPCVHIKTVVTCIQVNGAAIAGQSASRRRSRRCHRQCPSELDVLSQPPRSAFLHVFHVAAALAGRRRRRRCLCVSFQDGQRWRSFHLVVLHAESVARGCPASPEILRPICWHITSTHRQLPRRLSSQEPLRRVAATSRQRRRCRQGRSHLHVRYT